MRRFSITVCALFLVATLAQAQRYRATVLQDFGYGVAVPYGINASNQIVGYSEVYGGFDAYIWTGGQMRDLGNEGHGSTAYAVNDSGAAAGQLLNGPYRAALFENGTIVDLGVLAGFDSSIASGINGAGQIAGTCNRIYPTLYHAFIYQGGVMTDITPNGMGSEAYGINGTGQIVGVLWPDANNLYVSHAFLYSGGQMMDIGTLGGKTSTASAINAAGHVVGYSDIPGGIGDAFLYSNGTMRDLGRMGSGTYSSAMGVNASETVVGTGNVLNQDFTAFVYSNNAMTDLNQLTDGTNPGVYLTIAFGVNDRGYIACEGRPNSNADNIVSVLLTPYFVDTPTAYSITAGRYTSGNVASLASIDKNYLVVQSGPTFSNGSPPLSIVLTGTSTLANPTDVRMQLTGHADSVDLAETVEFYDYVANAWVLVQSTTATTSDSSFAAISTNPARFVQSGTLQMKARISLKPTGPISKSPWSLYLDQAVWNVSP